MLIERIRLIISYYLASGLAFGNKVLRDADLAGPLDNDVLVDGALAGLSLQGLGDLKKDLFIYL